MKALLVSASLKQRGKKAAAQSEAESSLEELERLAETAEINPVGKINVRLSAYNPALLIGSGKAQELKAKVEETAADIVIFDEELSPAQQRNLEKLFRVPVIDRTYLILEIFSLRARTREGKLQVKLARFSYSLSRLAGKGAHMGQQHGMIGTRGPGERQIEYEKRALRDKITELRKEIDSIKRERETQRKSRDAVPMPQVAIVGYTNAGKSTLLNKLTNSAAVYADDKLFATLDPTTKRVRLPSGGWALFTDTVGFIQKLPHDLIAAFRATLEEISYADLIIHVHDMSSPWLRLQHEAVKTTLKELGLSEIPLINAFNKSDAAPQLKDGIKASFKTQSLLFTSALTGEGLDRLLEMTESALSKAWKEYEISLPAKEGAAISEIHKTCLVKETLYSKNSVIIRFKATAANYQRLLKKLSLKARN